jgi:hypothetical protein
MRTPLSIYYNWLAQSDAFNHVAHEINVDRAAICPGVTEGDEDICDTVCCTGLDLFPAAYAADDRPAILSIMGRISARYGTIIVPHFLFLLLNGGIADLPARSADSSLV